VMNLPGSLRSRARHPASRAAAALPRSPANTRRGSFPISFLGPTVNKPERRMNAETRVAVRRGAL
jgi:hypothetical protein